MNINQEQTKRGSWEHFLLRAAYEISLSESQYEKIKSRYSQLQEILSVSDNPLLAEAHIFVQGSMGLRTTIKPVPNAPQGLDTIDADAIIWLPNAQGVEANEVLEAIQTRFEEGSRVEADIKPLRRGIRIEYADEKPGFHIDVTPARSINGDYEEKGQGMLEVPDRDIGWKASSPAPYSRWLNAASDMQISLESYLAVAKSRSIVEDAATQDPLPEYQNYVESNPLRATIKLLKRHRDEWAIRTGNEENRPISAVITTLATHAYLDVVEKSKITPLRPLDAIIEIVRGMPNHIKYKNGEFQVCNPEDDGENFAEKWNRPVEGHLYRKAFQDWSEDANQSVVLGLENYPSTEAFADAVQENFGMDFELIKGVNHEIPADWTMLGRTEGITRNTASADALFGSGVSGEMSQSDVKPVGRLG